MKFYMRDANPVVELNVQELGAAVHAYLETRGVQIDGLNSVRVAVEPTPDRAVVVTVERTGKLLTPEGVDVAEASARQDAFWTGGG